MGRPKSKRPSVAMKIHAIKFGERDARYLTIASELCGISFSEFVRSAAQGMVRRIGATYPEFRTYLQAYSDAEAAGNELPEPPESLSAVLGASPLLRL